MRRTTYTLYNILILACVMLTAGVGTAWGQRAASDHTQPNNYNEEWYFFYDRPSTKIVNKKDNINPSVVTDTVYVMPGQTVDITLQNGHIGENLNGYIRWYVEDGTDGNISNLIRPGYQEEDNNTGKGYWIEEELVQYANGYAWFRYYKRAGSNVSVPHGTESFYSNIKDADANSSIKNGTVPGIASYITYLCPNNYRETDETVVVCEASSLTDFGTPVALNATTREAATVSVKHRYVIKSAKTRQEQLNSLRKAISDDSSISNWLISNNGSLPNKMIETPNTYFKEYYEIHTPIGTGTNYRLAENINNYFVGTSNSPIQQVRWKTYNTDGSYISTERKDVPQAHPAVDNLQNRANIFKHTFTDLDNTKTNIRYITAEARNNDNGEWYPISLLKVYLEPNIEPQTAKELDEIRTETYLKNNHFVEVSSIQFEEEEDVIPFNNLNVNNNSRDTPLSLNKDTYYAYAYPNRYVDRAKEDRTVGRGEYALYRTLNYPNVSRQDQQYNDYFAKNLSNNGGYHHYVLDRTYYTSSNSQIGYFFYVDAADETGVVSKIQLDEPLCPYTQLIVTAWVCNMLHYSQNPVGADVGITLKGVATDGTETILTKYYSGELQRKHDDGGTFNNPSAAQWQQLYFKFTYDESFDPYDHFLVEIANNSQHSNGADYAIDDIRVYRSLPRVTVERKDKCISADLQVQSDFQTLLGNLGWTAGEKVPGLSEVETNPDLKRYRYGLKNLNPGSDNGKTLEYVGNAYFGFIQGLKSDDNGDILPDQADVTGQDESANGYRWVVVNKEVENLNVPFASYSVRVAISTDFNSIPTDEGAALQAERLLNIQAIKDYNGDLKANNVPNPYKGDGTEIEVPDENSSDEEYTSAIVQLYQRLQIPRIRCPWRDSEGNIFLSSIDVNNTDLRYTNEVIWKADESGNVVNAGTADGKYHVMLFSALQVANVAATAANPTAKCALVSPFTVKASVTVQFDTDTNNGLALCIGAQRRIKAKLEGYDRNTLEPVPIDKDKYFFDWYLGTRAQYDELTNRLNQSLKTAIAQYRDNNPSVTRLTIEGLEEWGKKSEDRKKVSDVLIELIKEDMLLSYTKPEENFTLNIYSEQIVAMPYVSDGAIGENVICCTEESNVDFELAPNEAPHLYPGLTGVSYPTNYQGAPLRLGQEHLKENLELTVPVRSDLIENMVGTAFAKPAGEVPVTIDDVAIGNPEIGSLEELHVAKYNPNSQLTIKWNNEALTYLSEGLTYRLRVPFVQVGDNGVLTSECDGTAIFEIKIVPEFLTWNGEADGNKKASWYNDASWSRSTKGELYLDNGQGTSDEDAKDNTNVNAGAFSPLYFTKITVDPEKAQELELIKEEDIRDGNRKNMLKLDGQTFDDYNVDADIRFDMAVNEAQEVVSYYGNTVRQVYLKPNALLVHQEYLEYDSARVEFNMTAGTPYWLSSPLKGIYAGDMYAPFTDGKEKSYAFGNITYNDQINHRWKLPFYQKAWNKAVAYVQNGSAHNADNAVDINAVASNWSIEYNDVWVPYGEGKGFYAKVEGKDARVRLPKSDTKYTYDEYATVTKAANYLNPQPTSREVGKLAGDEKGEVSVVLKSVDNDQTHFLVGNPYMSYLNMKEFFTENTGLKPMYWTLQDGSSTATVALETPVAGTPDIKWIGSETEKGPKTTDITGYVQPMRAFFVELEDGVNTAEIKFTPTMMATKPATTRAATKSISASSPVLTLTAERNGMKSRSILAKRDKADNGYNASEDAIVLLDSELDAPMAYTVAGSKAAQVNTVKSIRNIGLGVYNEAGDEATLTIEGLSRLAETLYLYDAHTRKSVKLEGDSYSLQVSGDSHGRYFLRDSDLGTELENTISIYSAQRGKVIVSSLRPVKDIKVVTLNGSQIRQFSVNTTQYTFNLPAGIYMIYASDGEREHTEKVIVR